VAAPAKVSKTTVSRVLNGKGELDESTAARVRKVIEELGYVPSSRAVGLARGRTRVGGMLVPSLTWPRIGEVLQGAVDVLETEQYGLLLFTCNRGEESIRQFGAQVSAESFDGLLVIEPEGGRCSGTTASTASSPRPATRSPPTVCYRVTSPSRAASKACRPH
jgi:LacI family transcriptional regulator